MKFSPNCQATGIGSLPYVEPQKAVTTIINNLKDIPHWPQLPLSGDEEGFSMQFVAPLIKLGLVSKVGKKAFFDTTQDTWTDGLTEFYTLYLAAMEGDEEALEFFAFPQEAATGFYAFLDYLKANGTGNIKILKGHVSGPLTVAFELTDENKRAAYYNPQIRDLVIKTLELQAYWQTKKLQEFGLPVLIFVDDPGLYAYGQSTHITLKKEDILEDLNTLFNAIHNASGDVGIHVCANTDWAMLMESNVDVINFDAYEYSQSMIGYGSQIADFFNQGRAIAWGIVPTSEAMREEDTESIYTRFMNIVGELEAKGIKRELILKQSIVTPSCGTGTLTPDLAEKIYQVTGELSAKLKGIINK